MQGQKSTCVSRCLVSPTLTYIIVMVYRKLFPDEVYKRRNYTDKV